jgi:hypothetical protein
MLQWASHVCSILVHARNRAERVTLTESGGALQDARPPLPLGKGPLTSPSLDRLLPVASLRAPALGALGRLVSVRAGSFAPSPPYWDPHTHGEPPCCHGRVFDRADERRARVSPRPALHGHSRL